MIGHSSQLCYKESPWELISGMAMPRWARLPVEVIRTHFLPVMMIYFRV